MAVRRVAIGAVVAAVVLAIVLALGWFRGGSGPAPTQPLSATAALATPALSFGDPLAARVEVLADAKQVDVGSLRVRPRFAPWRIVSETRERHVRRGDAARLPLDARVPVAGVPARAGRSPSAGSCRR